MAFGLDDFVGFDSGVGNLLGGGGDAGGGGIGGLLQALLGLGSGIGSAAGDLASGVGSLAQGAGQGIANNPLASLQALTGLGGMFQGLTTPQNAQAPAQFPQSMPALAGPYPRRGVPRADFQAQGLSGASPDFFASMNATSQQDPYAYSFQPQAADPRQVYA